MIEMTVDMERSITSLTPDHKSKQQMIWLCSVEHQMVIPMVIGMTEAMSIFSALTGEPPMRQLTHDLVRTILDQFDGQVERVEIDTDVFDEVVLENAAASQRLLEAMVPTRQLVPKTIASPHLRQSPLAARPDLAHRF